MAHHHYGLSALIVATAGNNASATANTENAAPWDATSQHGRGASMHSASCERVPSATITLPVRCFSSPTIARRLLPYLCIAAMRPTLVWLSELADAVGLFKETRYGRATR